MHCIFFRLTIIFHTYHSRHEKVSMPSSLHASVLHCAPPSYECIPETHLLHPLTHCNFLVQSPYHNSFTTSCYIFPTSTCPNLSSSPSLPPPYFLIPPHLLFHLCRWTGKRIVTVRCVLLHGHLFLRTCHHPSFLSLLQLCFKLYLGPPPCFDLESLHVSVSWLRRIACLLLHMLACLLFVSLAATWLPFSYCRILTKPRFFFLVWLHAQGKLFVLFLCLYLLCGLSWPWYCRILFCVCILVVLTFSFHADGATRHFEFSATEGKAYRFLFFLLFVFLAILRRFISVDRVLHYFATFNACMCFCLLYLVLFVCRLVV
jgi:hypothetical protein